MLSPSVLYSGCSGSGGPVGSTVAPLCASRTVRARRGCASDWKVWVLKSTPLAASGMKLPAIVNSRTKRSLALRCGLRLVATERVRLCCDHAHCSHTSWLLIGCHAAKSSVSSLARMNRIDTAPGSGFAPVDWVVLTTTAQLCWMPDTALRNAV